jgi:hypothetical protein
MTLANSLVFVFTIEPQHLLGFIRYAHLLRCHGRHLAKIVDLPGDDQRVFQISVSVPTEDGHHVEVGTIGREGAAGFFDELGICPWRHRP